MSITPEGNSIMCNKYIVLLDFLAILEAILHAYSDLLEKSIGTIILSITDLIDFNKLYNLKLRKN